MHTPQAPCSALTLAELQELYLDHARTYYRRRDRSLTGEHLNIEASLKLLARSIDVHQPAAGVTKHVLRAWLLQLVEQDLSRTYINATLARVRRMFRWASDLDYIPPETDAQVRAVRPLPAHRSPARETQPRTAAEPAHVALILPFLPTVPRHVVQLLQLTGARVSELLTLTNADLTSDDEGRWFAIPPHHKTSHKQRSRVIPLSSTAMHIVARYQRPLCPNDFLFASPKDPARHYSKSSILAAIKRACAKADVPPFCTHQLRHTAATLVRQRKGLDAAQRLLGHASRATTERYTHDDEDRASLFTAAEVLQ